MLYNITDIHGFYASCIDNGDYVYKTMNIYDAEYYAEHFDDDRMDRKDQKGKRVDKIANAIIHCVDGWII